MQDWLAAAALVASIVAIIMTLFRNNSSGIWKLADRISRIDTDRAEVRRQLNQKIEDKHDEAVDLFGETMRGYVEHIRLFELEVYKNFVRRETFDTTIKSVTDVMNTRFDKLEKQLEAWRERRDTRP